MQSPLIRATGIECIEEMPSDERVNTDDDTAGFESRSHERNARGGGGENAGACQQHRAAIATTTRDMPRKPMGLTVGASPVAPTETDTQQGNLSNRQNITDSPIRKQF